jgi:hypothetical protein
MPWRASGRQAVTGLLSSVAGTGVRRLFVSRADRRTLEARGRVNIRALRHNEDFRCLEASRSRSPALKNSTAGRGGCFKYLVGKG